MSRLPCADRCRALRNRRSPTGACRTEWVLLTSGTTGAPKLVAPQFATLTAAIAEPARRRRQRRVGHLLRHPPLRRAADPPPSPPRRRIVRAVRRPTRAIADYLVRLGRARRHAHLGHAVALAPRADEPGRARDRSALHSAVRRNRRSGHARTRCGRATRTPASRHAFASTEAGVGFEVDDGLEGFPAGLVGAPGGVQIRVDDGSLRIRSARTALGYVGDEPSALADDRTDSSIPATSSERRGRSLLLPRPTQRHHQRRRTEGLSRGGGGGHQPPPAGPHVDGAAEPEPDHRLARRRGRRARPDADAGADAAAFKREILQICRDTLAPHKVPATIRFVPALEFAAAGKLARHA